MRNPILIIAFALVVLSGSQVQAEIDHPDFRNVDDLNLVEDAAHAGTFIRLTRSAAQRRGAVWYRTKQSVAGGFVTRFSFRISETGGHVDAAGLDGGNGLAFVIQNSGDRAVGAYGEGLGYSDIPNALAIEFDTWHGGFADDPNHNHISVQTRGRLPLSSHHSWSLARTTAIPDLSDGAVHTVVVEYVPGRLAIFLDGCTEPVLTVDVDIDNLLNLDRGRAFLGFTAATSSAYQNHDLLSWHLREGGMASPADPVICEGDTATLEAPEGYASYQWSTGEQSKRITVREAGRYSVTVSDTLGCSGTTFSWEVEVRTVPRPDARIAAEGPVNLCEGDTVLLAALPEGLRYRWSTGEEARIIMAAKAGEYRVIVINEEGCADTSATVTVQVEPTPQPIILGDTIVCPGETARLDAGPGYASYQWSTGAITRSIIVDQPGSYIVEVTNGSGCRGRSDTIRVMVRKPEPPLLPDSIAFCRGETATLDAGAGYTSYLWSTGETSRTISVDQPGEYRVIVTTDEGCTVGSEIVLVTIHPTPQPKIHPDGSPRICSGETITLDAGAGYASYQWSTGETSRTISVDRSGRYFVEVTDTSGCRGTSAPVNVTILPSPTPRIQLNGTAVLCNREARRTLTAQPGFLSYHWSTGAASRSIEVNRPGTYSVTVIDTNGCSGTAEILLEEGAGPTVQAGPDTSICPGTEIQLHASGGIAYRWSPTDDLSCTDCPDPIARPRTDRTYRVTVTDADGCTASADVHIDVRESAPSLLFSVPRDLRVSPGEEVTVPIILEGNRKRSGPTELTLELRFDPGLLQFISVSNKGTLTEGLPISAPADPGLVRPALALPADLSGGGTVAFIRFRGFLGATEYSELPLLAVPSEGFCGEIRTVPGRISIDSVCGLSFRLIEAADIDYDLVNNRPNPFNRTTTITFVLGLEGPTRLEILNAGGRQTALLLDEYLPPGSYSINWDARGYPSGLYYCRLTSGHWSRTIRMTLVQ